MMVYNNTEQMTSGELVKVSFDLYVTMDCYRPKQNVVWLERSKLGH